MESLVKSERDIISKGSLEDPFIEKVKNQKFGILLAFMSLLLLGILPIITNSRPSELKPLNFALYLTLWELVAATPVFTTERLYFRNGMFQKSISSSDRFKLSQKFGLMGIFFAAATFFYVVAFEKAGTVSASIAIQIYPILAIPWEILLLKKKIPWQKTFFIVLLLGSLYYLGTEGTGKIADFNSAFGYALIVPCIWGFAHVATKAMMDKAPITANQVTFLRVLVSSVVLFIVACFVNGVDEVMEGLFSWNFQKYALIMGIVYYFELVIWYTAVKHIDVTLASSITTPNPIITMVLSLIILRESILGFQIVGMILVILALYGLLWTLKRESQKK